jgi:hypothetical protein
MELKGAPFCKSVEEELEQFQGCCIGTHIARVADAVATNGDLCAVRVVLFWSDFTNNHGVAYFLPLVRWDVVVVDAKKCLDTGNTFGVGGLPRANALAETAKLIGV